MMTALVITGAVVVGIVIIFLIVETCSIKRDIRAIHTNMQSLWEATRVKDDYTEKEIWGEEAIPHFRVDMQVNTVVEMLLAHLGLGIQAVAEPTKMYKPKIVRLEQRNAEGGPNDDTCA